MYSQNNEEQVIADYFKNFVGTFADVGANNGTMYSNSRALVEKGWKGILVEPAPAVWNDLKDSIKDFPGVYAYPFAIADTNGEITLHDSGPLITQADHSLVSTIVPEETKRFASVTSYTPVTVKCFRWKTFLNRVKYKTFDFISLDIEGAELVVLPQIDLTSTSMVCVEWNGKNKQFFVDACQGFKLIHENAENLIFAR